jgi:hypothetical protein
LAQNGLPAVRAREKTMEQDQADAGAGRRQGIGEGQHDWLKGQSDPMLLAGATVEKSIDSEGREYEYEFSASARLLELEAQFASGMLAESTRLGLLNLADGFTTVRPVPPIHPMTKGTGRLCLQFDLSERAVHLIAARADE